MPKMANLSSMKSIAKDAIDQNYFYNRDTFPRSKLEEERLVNKIKDMEKHTGMDMSPLLDSTDKEAERIRRHKKAFETYKSYAFLKSGLKQTNLEKKLTNEETASAEQYKFPSADKIAKVFINDDYKYEMLKQPEEHYKPGRKSKFTPRQFLKKYYGQDGMSLDHVDISDRPIYSFNDEMKRMYPLDSLSLIAEVKEKQRLAVENFTKRELEKSRNPTLVDLDSLYKNQLNSGEKEIEYHEPFLRNPIVEEEFEERTRKYIENTRPGPNGEPPNWDSERARRFMKDERLEYPEAQLLKRMMKIEEKRFEKLQAKENNAATEAQETPKVGTGEKWKPSDTDKDDAQDARDKVYSDYLDKVKAEHLEKGNAREFTNVERKFAKRYVESALKPKLNDKTGKVLEYKDVEEDYIMKLEGRRANIQELEKIKNNAKLKSDETKKADRYKDTTAINNNKRQMIYESINTKSREDMNKKLSKEKSSLRKDNEEFLYRHEYFKNNEEAVNNIKFEETPQFKILKNASLFDKNNKVDFENNIDSHKYSERKLGKDFDESLSRGDVIKGLLERQKNLKQEYQDKDLSEIAHGDDPSYQNLYKQYMNYDKPSLSKDDSEEINERERKFMQAVQQNYKETSPKASRTFQEYEDLKKALNTKNDPYDEVNNSVAPENSYMNNRDWTSKIWSGKISNEEFEKYNYNKIEKEDSFGIQNVVFEQRDHPGYGSNNFISHQDKNRLNQEFFEQQRRELVLNGTVSEQDSHKYMSDFMEVAQKQMKKFNSKTFQSNKEDIIGMMKAVYGGEQAREYYFDPKQGVSLEEHIESVKKVNPDSIIKTYVDNDGFTVVQRITPKKYKYNLQNLLDNTPEDMEMKFSKKIKDLVDAKDEEELARFMDKQNAEGQNLYGELLDIYEFYNGIVDNIDQFKDDINEQIQLIQLRHKYMKKMSQSDFVKNQLPEEMVMENLKKSYEQGVINDQNILTRSDMHSDYLSKLKQKNSNSYEEAKANIGSEILTKEEYAKLRAQIKERKEAKAKLIKQGFPSLKNYVYL